MLPSAAGAAPVCTPSADFTSCAVYFGADENQQFRVPKGVTSVRAQLQGSGGGVSTYDGPTGGRGGRADGTIEVTPGQLLNLTVGTTTWGGGGTPGIGIRGTAGHGGGLTAIWNGEPLTGTPVLLAGGGGGASGAGAPDPSGGDAGGAEGGSGNSSSGPAFAGGGGTQSVGGTGGLGGGTAGTRFQGGNGSDGADSGGGGGAGWFGGGGGHGQVDENDANDDGGGGGGSSYVSEAVADGSTTGGGGAAPGQVGTVVLEWVAPAAVIAAPVNGSTTSDSTPVVSGTGVPGGTITVVADDSEIACAEGVPVAVSEAGTWSCTPVEPFAAGTVSLVALQRDPAAPQATYPASTATEVTIVESTTPTAPQDLAATRGDASATLTFDAPASDGGSDVTGYQYSLDGTTWTDLSTTGTGPYGAVVTGLVNGQTYDISVRAVNAIGAGTATAEAAAVTPVATSTAPGAPTDLVVTAGDEAVTVAFVAPVDDGGSAITGYEFSLDGSVWTALATTGPGPFAVDITGLTNGTGYTVQVRAVNAIGAGPAAAAATVTPVAVATVPGAPLGLAATAGDGSVMLTFTSPASNGGSAVTAYEFSVDGVVWSLLTTTGSDPFTGTVAGLTNGVSYGIQIRALNAVGAGVAASVVVTPQSASPTTTTSTPSYTDGSLAYTGVSALPTLLTGSLLLLIGGGIILAFARRRTAGALQRH